MQIPRRRKGVNIAARQDFGVSHFLHVDGGNLRPHLHGLPDCARFHFSVHRNRHVRRHLDLLLHCVEAVGSKGNRVRARPDVDNGVASFAISSDDPGFFD